MRSMLAVISLGAVIVAVWLTQMYVTLHHESWLLHAATTGILALYSLTTIFVAEDVLGGPWATRAVVAGAVFSLWFAYAAVRTLVTSAHFEGFWLPVAVVFGVQAIATLALFARPRLLSVSS